jgi:hypothetical protein
MQEHATYLRDLNFLPLKVKVYQTCQLEDLEVYQQN